MYGKGYGTGDVNLRPKVQCKMCKGNDLGRPAHQPVPPLVPRCCSNSHNHIMSVRRRTAYVHWSVRHSLVGRIHDCLDVKGVHFDHLSNINKCRKTFFLCTPNIDLQLIMEGVFIVEWCVFTFLTLDLICGSFLRRGAYKYCLRRVSAQHRK